MIKQKGVGRRGETDEDSVDTSLEGLWDEIHCELTLHMRTVETELSSGIFESGFWVWRLILFCLLCSYLEFSC